MGNSSPQIETTLDPDVTQQSLTESQRGEDLQFMDQKSLHIEQTRIRNPRMQQHPYDCIGLLSWNDATDGMRYIGTAFLVDSRLILTALHNVIDNFGKQHTKMKFYPKCNISTKTLANSNQQAVSVKEMSKFYIQNKKDQIHPSQDLCLLLLEKDVIRQKYFTLGYDYCKNQNSNAQIFGYPKELIDKYYHYCQYGAKGRINSIQNGVIYYQIDTSKGQSGSPLIVQTNKHEKIAIGVHAKACNSRPLNCSSQFTAQNIRKVHRWAYELTGQPSKIKIVDAQKLEYYTNPLAQNQRKTQQYAYITLVHDFVTKSINPQTQLCQIQLKKKASSQLDLWSTIKDGKFNIYRYPYNCIGLIVAKYTDSNQKVRKHYGTGFLINSRIVLTSIYNLIKFENTYTFEYEDLLFYPGLHGDIQDKINEKYIVIDKRYNFPKLKPQTVKQTVDASLAVLLLDKPAIVSKRYIMIGQDYEEKNGQVYLFGYGRSQLNRRDSQSFSDFKQRGSEGKIKQVKQDMISHDAYSQSGSQGSPLLIQYVKGEFFIVGIHIVSKKKGSQQSECIAIKMTPKRVRMINNWIKNLGEKRQAQSYNLKENSLFNRKINFSFLEQYKFYLKHRKSKEKIHTKSEIFMNLAYYAHMLGKYEKSNHFLVKELELSSQQSFFKNKQKQVHQVFYHNLMGLNNLYLQRLDSAQDNFKRAINIINQQTANVSKREKAIVFNNMGILYIKKKNKQLVDEYFKLSNANINKKDHVQSSIYNCNTACYLFTKKQMNLKQHQDCLSDAFEKLNNINFPQNMLHLAYFAHNIAINHYNAANYKGIIQYLEVQMTIMENLELIEHPSFLNSIQLIVNLVDNILVNQIIDRKIILKAVKLLKKVAGNDLERQLLLTKLMNVIMPIDEDMRIHQNKNFKQ